MKKKNLLAALLAGSLALSLTACSSDTAPEGDPQAGGEGSDPFQVSMILKTNSSEFWRLIQAGAEAYVKEHPDLVKLSIKGPPSETSYEEQLNMIQTDLGTAEFDGYLIAPLQSDAVANQIANTDKPVMAFDTRIESDKCLSFIGTGNKEAAKQGAKAAVEAAKAAGCAKVALGHHFDDVVETYMLSLFYEGRISCFQPVTFLDRSGITLIRPLLYTPEHYVRSFAARHALPVVHNPCPADGNTKRQEIKDLLRQLEQTMPGLRERIFGAIQRYPLKGWQPDRTRTPAKRPK